MCVFMYKKDVFSSLQAGKGRQSKQSVKEPQLVPCPVCFGKVGVVGVGSKVVGNGRKGVASSFHFLQRWAGSVVCSMCKCHPNPSPSPYSVRRERRGGRRGEGASERQSVWLPCCRPALHHPATPARPRPPPPPLSILLWASCQRGQILRVKISRILDSRNGRQEILWEGEEVSVLS